MALHRITCSMRTLSYCSNTCSCIIIPKQVRAEQWWNWRTRREVGAQYPTHQTTDASSEVHWSAHLHNAGISEEGGKSHIQWFILVCSQKLLQPEKGSYSIAMNQCILESKKNSLMHHNYCELAFTILKPKFRNQVILSSENLSFCVDTPLLHPPPLLFVHISILVALYSFT